MKICQIKKSDFKECANILYEEFNKQNEKFSKKTAFLRIKETYRTKFALCAKENKKILGLILVTDYFYDNGKCLWIEELAVKEEYQKKGIGTRLIKSLLKIAKKNKIKTINLNSKNFNLKFYEKFGFKENGYIMVEKNL